METYIEIIPSSLKSRNDFGALFLRMELVTWGVEIGTHRGDFTKVLADTWSAHLNSPNGALFTIDNYHIGYSHRDPIASINRNRNLDQRAAYVNLLEYHQKILFVHEDSVIAANRFQPNSMDFVYLDGNHEREYIEQDLKMWWSKIKSGGILAGHDWDCQRNPGFPWRETVRPAVCEFAERHRVPVYIVPDPDFNPESYYIVKP